jgi:methyltransferase (TIGR00027 family)
MRENEASRTAEYMALFRALESIRAPGTRLFEDPLAGEFLSARYKLALGLARVPVSGRLVPRYIDARWPGPRAAGVVRTRMIDDAFEQALRDGIETVLVLGAGFDSRAYRIPGAREARVFEVDHPSTQKHKRAVVERVTGGDPAHVTWVEIDFNEERLGEALERAEYPKGSRALVLWEGVVSYLTADAVDATLAEIAALTGSGSRLVVTYQQRSAIDGAERFEGAAQTNAAVERAGEPFTFGWDPGEIGPALAEHGFELIEDLATAEAAERYLPPLGRDEPVSSFYRVARAERR